MGLRFRAALAAATLMVATILTWTDAEPAVAQQPGPGKSAASGKSAGSSKSTGTGKSTGTTKSKSATGKSAAATKNAGPNPFPKRVPSASLDGGREWLNTSGEITLQDLRG